MKVLEENKRVYRRRNIIRDNGCEFLRIYIIYEFIYIRSIKCFK